jgi:hypothetical protein
LGAAVLGLVLTGVGLGPSAVLPQAEAAQVNPRPPTGSLSVTFVGVVCDDYSDVQANRARNNIQESLQDLGPDSKYQAGNAVEPGPENAGMSADHCRPLPGLQFTIGSGMVSKTVASYYLSYVSGATATVTTVDSVPQLDSQGRPVGSNTVPGAVTVTLDRETTTAQRGSLWAQGGKPTDPRPVDTTGYYPELSFAALRCAYDAVNGDNVEKVAFNSGSRHVYCYYYAIGHHVDAGTITVQKVLAADTIGQGVFRFDGDISYADSNGDGTNDFSLTATKPGQIVSQSFVRAVGTAWSFQETLPTTADWLTPDSPVCTTSGGGQAVFSNDAGDTHRTSGLDPTTVTLTGAGQSVVCTYTNARQAPGPEPTNFPFRRLWKEVIGSDGEFDFEVTFPGEAPIDVDDVTVTDDGTSQLVRERTGSVAAHAGLISVTEQVPVSDGTWTLAQGNCAVTNGPNPDLSTAVSVPMTISQGQDGSFTAQLSRALTATENADCLITNTFSPAGQIAVNKQVLADGLVVADAFQPAQDGTVQADFAYTVLQQLVLPQPQANAVLATYGLTAAVTPSQVGQAVAAQPDSTASPWPDGFLVSDPSGAPRYHYVIEESTPAPTARGNWQVVSAQCVDRTTGQPVASSQGQTTVEFELTSAIPDVSCTFTNRWLPLALVTIVKQASSDTDLRGAPAQLDFFCAYRDEVDGDGDVLFGNSVTVAAGLGQADTEFGSTLPLTCQLSEPEEQSGANPGVDWSVALSMTNHGQPGPAIALDQPIGIDLGDEVVITAVNSYTAPPPASLSLVKNTTADRSIRPDPAQLSLTCQAAGATVIDDALSVPAGESSLTQTYQYGDPPYDQPLTCQIDEPAAGQSAPWQPSARLSLTKNGQPWTPDPPVGLGQPFTVERGDVVVATVDNDFAPLPERSVWKGVDGPQASFDFQIEFPGQDKVDQTVEVPADGTEAVVQLSGLPVTAAGAIQLSETVPDPAQAGGVWQLTAAVCQVSAMTSGASRQMTLNLTQDSGQPNRWLADSGDQLLEPTDNVSCDLTNAFTPAGRIDLTKTVDEAGLVPDDAFYQGGAVFGYNVVQWAQDLTDPESELAPTGQSWTASARTTPSAHQQVSALPAGAWPAGFPVSTTQTRYQYVITEQTPPGQAAGVWRVGDISCAAPTVATDLAAGSVTVEPTAAQPVVDCQFTNQWVAGAKLTIVKNATDDSSLRTGSAIIEYRCEYTLSGQPAVIFAQDIEVESGQSTGSDQFQVGADTTCTVTEQATGAPAYVTPGVSLSATNHGQPVSWTPALDEPFTVALGDDVVFTVDNTYSAPTVQIGLTKQTVSDSALRPAPAQLNLNCVSPSDYPAVGGDLLVASGRAANTAQYQAHYPVTCVVTEPASGVESGYEVVTQASLSGVIGSTTEVVPLVLGQPFSLNPGDNVIVAVNNIVRPQPSATPWRFWKEAQGADGSFDITAEVGQDGEWLPVSQTGLAVSDGSQALIGQIDQEDWPDSPPAAFDVRLTETLPSSTSGVWRASRAYCEVQHEGSTTVVELLKQTSVYPEQIYSGDDVFAWEDSVDCHIVNQFVPAGRIQIAKNTVLNDPSLADDAYPGGKADFSFSVVQQSGPAADQLAPTGRSWTARAETGPTDPNDPKAVPGPADPSWPEGFPVSLTGGPVYRYVISETAPAPTAAGQWRLSGVDCGSAQVGDADLDGGSVTIELTEDIASANCTFTNTWLQAATLTVVKTATADTSLRPEAAELVLICQADQPYDTLFGTSVTVAAGVPQGSISFQSGYPTLQCTVTEDPDQGGATGAGDGVIASASARISVDGVESPLPDSGSDPFSASFTVVEGQQVVVTVDNVYTPEPTHLRLVKDVIGTYQPATAPVLGVVCSNQSGQTVLDGSLTWAPPSGQTATGADFDPGSEPVSCVVTELVDGTGPGLALNYAQVTGRLLPDGPALVGLNLGQPFQIGRGQSVEFTVGNNYAPAPTRRVLKQTVGAQGSFQISGEFPATDVPWQFDQTTGQIAPGQPVEVVVSQPEAIVEESGLISLDEIMPESDTGQWSLTGASCLVRSITGGSSWTVDLTIEQDSADLRHWSATSPDQLAPTEQADCTLVNTFTPAGRINLTKTADQTGPDPAAGLPAQFDYSITQLSGPRGGALAPTGRIYSGQVALPDPSLGLTAVPIQPGASGLPWPEGFPVSDQTTTYQYQISESLPAPTAAGAWQVEAVTCQPGAVLSSVTGATAVIELSAATPVADCQFVNRWVPAASLSLVKTATLDLALRPNPALVDLVCRDAASGAATRRELVLPEGRDSASISFTSVTDLICQVQELQSNNGADPASGVTWDYRLALTNHGLPGASLDLNWDFPVSQGDDIRVELNNYYTPPPPAQVTVVKLTSADQTIRPERAILNVDCQDGDGQTLVDGTVEVAPGLSQDQHLFQADQPMSCVVTEASGGQGQAYAVSASAELRDGSGGVQPISLGQAFAVARGDQLTFTVANQFQNLPRRQVSKQALGGAGQFDFEIAWPGQSQAQSVTGLSLASGATGLVATNWSQAAGPLQIVETVPDPAVAGGVWTAQTASCQVTDASGAVSALELTLTPGPGSNQWTALTSQDLPAGAAADCLLVNQFTPAGRIQLHKTVSPDGLAPDDALPAQFSYNVTQYAVDGSGQTSATGLAASASVEMTADHLSDQPVQPDSGWPAGFEVTTASGGRYQYVISEVLPAPTVLGAWHVSAVSCAGAQPVTDWQSGPAVTVELTASQPETDCTFTNQWVEAPVASLSLVKIGSVDTGLRPGSAILDYQCTEIVQGQPVTFSQSLVLPAGQASVSTGFQSFAALTCQVTETATGAGPQVGQSATVDMVLNGQPVVPSPALGEDFDVALGDQVTFTVTNGYTPPAQVTVSKATTGDLTARPDPAQLALSCVDAADLPLIDGAVTVAPGQTSASQVFLSDQTLTCQVTEPDSGAAPAYAPRVSAQLTDQTGQVSPVELGQAFTVVPGQSVVFAVSNDFDQLPQRQIRKLALGGSGVFSYDLDLPGLTPLSLASVTAGPAAAVAVASGWSDQPGSISLTETVPDPAAAGGVWTLTGGSCQVTRPDGSVWQQAMTVSPGPAGSNQWTAQTSQPLGLGDAADCLVTNQFTPAGQIQLVKTVDPAGLVAYDAFPADFSYSVTQYAVDLAGQSSPTGQVSVAAASVDASAHSGVVATPGASWPAGFEVTTGQSRYQYVITESLPAATFVGGWQVADVTCQGGQTVARSGPAVTLELTAGSPEASCTFTNRWVEAPSGSLTIVKRGSDDLTLRSGAAVLSYQCVESGSGQAFSQDLVLPPGAGSTSTGFQAFAPLTCRVDETATGAASGVTAGYQTSLTVNGQAVSPSPDLGQDFAVGLGDQVAFEVDNTYQAPPPPAALRLTKHTSADPTVRDQPAQVALTCSQSGQTRLSGQVTVAVGLAAASQSFQAPGDSLSCLVTEPADGAAAGYSADPPTMAVTNHGLPLTSQPGLDQPFTVLAGDDIDIVVDNTFSALPPPPPEPYQRVHKQALGEDGEFDFVVDYSDGGFTAVLNLPVAQTTTVQVASHSSQTGGPAGFLRVTEDTASSGLAHGQWSLVQASCEVGPVSGGATRQVAMEILQVSADVWTATSSEPLSPEDNADCTLVNRFQPVGSIDLIKTIDPAGLTADAFPGGQVDFDYSLTQLAGTDNSDLTPTGRVYWAEASLDAAHLSVPALPSGQGLPWPDGFLFTDYDAGQHYQYVIAETLPPPTAAGSWRLEQVNCSPGTVIVPGSQTASSVTIEPTVDEAEVACELVNQWQPTARLSLVKQATADDSLRPGQARLVVECSYESAAGTALINQEVVLPAGATSASLDLTAPGDLTCQVTEPDNGAGEDVEWSYSLSASQAGQPGPAADLGESFVVTTGQDVVYQVTNHYVRLAQVSLTKLTTADQTIRPDPAQLAVRCADRDDGSPVVDQVLEVPPGQASASLQFQSSRALYCVVTESSAGQATGYTWSYAMTAVNQFGPVEPVDLNQPIAVDPGDRLTIELENVLTPPPPPPPPPPPVPSGGSTLPAAWAGLAVLLLAGGLGLLDWRRRRLKAAA